MEISTSTKFFRPKFYDHDQDLFRLQVRAVFAGLGDSGLIRHELIRELSAQCVVNLQESNNEIDFYGLSDEVDCTFGAKIDGEIDGMQAQVWSNWKE